MQTQAISARRAPSSRPTSSSHSRTLSMASDTNHPKQSRYPPHRHISKPSTPRLLPPLQATTQLQLDTYLDKAEAEASTNILIPRPMPCYYHTRGCTKKFDIAEELSVHVTVDITTDHDHEWCKDCQLGFLDFRDFKRHLVVAPNNIHHYCPVCGLQETKSEEAMQLHVQKTHKLRRLTCLGCGLIVNGAVAILEHFKEGICTALQKRTDIVTKLPDGVHVDGICGGEFFSTAEPEIFDNPLPRSATGRSRASSITSSAMSIMSTATSTYTESGVRLVQPKFRKQRLEKLVIHRFNNEQRVALTYGFRPNNETLEEFGQRCLIEENVSALENVPWNSGTPTPTEETVRTLKKKEAAPAEVLPTATIKGKPKPKLNSIPSSGEVRAVSAAKEIAIAKALDALGLQRVTTSDVALIPALTPAKPKPLATSLPPRIAPSNSILAPIPEDQTPQEPTLEPTSGSPPLVWETPSRVPSLTWSDTTPPHESIVSPYLPALDSQHDWQQPKMEWETSINDWETPSNGWQESPDIWSSETNGNLNDSSTQEAASEWQASPDDWFNGANEEQRSPSAESPTTEEEPVKSTAVAMKVDPCAKTDAASSRRQFLENLVKKTKQADMTAKPGMRRRDSAVDVDAGVKLSAAENKTESDWW